MRHAKRVAILGSASAGKTTLAQALARRYGTVWVPEYLREFVDTQGRLPVSADQIHIAREQVRREAALLPQARGYLFCDTSPLMTAVYSRQYFDGIDAGLEALVRTHRYDVTLVCAPDLPWVPDGLHREPEDMSGPVTALLLEELGKRGVPYTMVSGTTQERLATVAAVLENRGPATFSA